MSDRMPAVLTIGGRLKKKDVSRLIEAINDAGVSLEWGDAYVTITDETELIEWARSNAGHLVCRDDEAAWGEFPSLESLCRELGLAYNRHSSAKYEYDAEFVWFRPGMKQPASSLCTDDGNLTVERRQIAEALKLLKMGKTKQAIKRLEALAEAAPELPEFKIA